MAAAHLFAEKDYNGVSMREISEQSGVSKPMIYYYFGNKEGIYTELVNMSLRYVSDKIQGILSLDLTVREKIAEYIRARFQMALRHPEFVKFYIAIFVSAKNLPFLDSLRTEMLYFRTLLADMVKEGMDAGELNGALNPDMVADFIAGIPSIYIFHQMNVEDEILSEQLADDIVDHLFQGLKVKGGAPLDHQI